MNAKITKQTTPSYITTALIYAGLSMLISAGYVGAMYVLIGLLSLTTFFVIVVSGTILQSDLIPPPTKKTSIVQNLSLRFLVQMLIVICIFQIYSAGYVYLAGMYSVTSAIVITGSFVRLIYRKEK